MIREFFLTLVQSAALQKPRNTRTDRKSTRLNSSHGYISYAVFCLKNKNSVAVVTFVSATASSARAVPGWRAASVLRPVDVCTKLCGAEAPRIAHSAGIARPTAHSG